MDSLILKNQIRRKKGVRGCSKLEPKLAYPNLLDIAHNDVKEFRQIFS